MPTVTKLTLSGSTDGRGIPIAGLVNPTLITIHTGPTSANTYDEVWLYLSNFQSFAMNYKFYWGGETSPDDVIEGYAYGETGLFEVVGGLVIRGNATPKVIKCEFAMDPEFGKAFSVHGYANRIAP